jgi:HEPN domain-containing protein
MSNTDYWVNEYARELKTIGKEEYIAARTLYLNCSLRSARILTHHCVEKLLKAICLYNRIKVSDTGHDIKSLYDRCAASVKLRLPEDATNFIGTLRDDYVHIRYGTRPVRITRSELWLLDKVILSLLRYCHSHRVPNTNIAIRGSAPLRNEFGDLLKPSSLELEIKGRTLIAETIFDGTSDPTEIQNNFTEIQISMNTIWDNIKPDQRPKVYETLGQYVAGYEKLNRNPDSYDSTNLSTITLAPEFGEFPNPIVPLNFRTETRGARNSPPSKPFYD